MNEIPCLGLCLGMQVMTIEYARNVLGLTDAHSTEFNPTTLNPVIDLMESQTRSHRHGRNHAVRAYIAELIEGSQVANAYGKTVVSERHRHRYEFNPKFRQKI